MVCFHGPKGLYSVDLNSINVIVWKVKGTSSRPVKSSDNEKSSLEIEKREWNLLNEWENVWCTQNKIMDYNDL